ncbi:MAG TPA: hypothetical protein VIG52_02120 [Methyloceanibacter sp.]
MTRDAILVSYGRSFICVFLFVAIFLASGLITTLIFVDFVHGNPHRTSLQTYETMAVTPLFAGIFAVIVTLSFIPSQCFEAWFARSLIPRFGDHVRFWTLGALPFTAILTWYCYDYLIPAGGGPETDEPSNWMPYEHGLTVPRYLTALFAQTLVTLLNVIFLDDVVRHRSPKMIVLPLLAIAVVLGAVDGYFGALGQYKFLD